MPKFIANKMGLIFLLKKKRVGLILRSNKFFDINKKKITCQVPSCIIKFPILIVYIKHNSILM